MLVMSVLTTALEVGLRLRAVRLFEEKSDAVLALCNASILTHAASDFTGVPPELGAKFCRDAAVVQRGAAVLAVT